MLARIRDDRDSLLVVLRQDPCDLGSSIRAEFHTFANEGPMFQEKIQIEVGEIVERDSFVFADLLPAASRVGHRRRVGETM